MSNDLAGQEAQAAANAASADSALRAIARGIAQTSGGEFYRALASECGTAFGACDVTISALAADGAHTEILGSWTRAGLPVAAERPLADTAAELAMQAGVIHHASGARAEHPQDDRLARLYAESYLGVPILDGRGDVVGVLELTSDAPGMAMEPAATIVAALAPRVVAELERSQAEAALRDSEMRYRTLIEDSFHLVAEIVDERFVFTSAGYGDALGYEPEELLGGSLYDLIHPDDRRSVAADLQAMVAQRRSARFTVRMRHHDGPWRWIESTARAFRASTGEYRTTLFSRDITAQQETEQSLREREERFRTLVNDLQVGVLLHGPGGEILHANDTCLQLLGLTRDEVLGGNPQDAPWELVREDGTPMPLDEQAHLVVLGTGESVRDAVVGVKRYDGSPILWLLVSAEPRTGPDGERQVVVTFTDISLRIAAEERLRDSEERFRLLAENASDVILRYAANGECTWVSPSVESVTGYTPEEFMLLSPEQTVLPEDMERGRKVWARAVEGRGDTIEYRFPHKHGHVIWLELTSKAVRDPETGAINEIHMSGRDITARKEAVNELRESEARFRLLAENASDVIVTFDADGRCTWVSPSVTSVAGYQPDELIGTFPRFMVHPDDAAETSARRAEVLASDGITTTEFRFPHKDGRFLWMESKSKAIRNDETGEILQIQLTARDITARKQAEDDVRESEGRFRLLAENATDVIARFDPSGVCTWVSPSIEVVTGYQPHEIIGQLPRTFLHPDDVESALEAKQRTLSGTDSVTAVYRFPRKEGGYVWMESTNKAVRADDGSVIEIQMSARDITLRKQAEDDVRESEERFRLLAENATDIIARYDAEGTCLWISPSVTTVTGFLPEEIIGLPLPQLVHRKDAAMIEDATKLMADGTETFSTTFRVPHKDGSRIWLEATNRMIRDPKTGRVVEIHTSSRDVTARKEAEEGLLRSEHLFRATLESTADGILVTKPGGLLLYWNSLAAEMLHIPQDILERGDATAFAQHIVARVTDAQGLVKAIASLPEDKPASAGVWAGFDGRQFEIFAHPLEDDRGERLRVWSVRDVSAHHEAEIALRESEERFRSLAEHTTDLVLGIVGPGVIDYASPNAEAILGYPAASLLGANAMDIVFDEDLARIFEDFERAAATGEAARSTIRVKHGNGEMRWFDVTSSFFRNERDELRAAVTARDVTNQKLAQDALRESEERLRAVVNSAPLVLFAIGLDRRFVLAEGEALRSVNLTSADLIGRTIDDVYANFPTILGNVERALAGEEFAAQDAVGDIVFQAHYAPTRDADGTITGMIGVAYDITSRMAAEEALRESEETARALLNAPTDGAVLVDRNGTILAMNATAERRFVEHAEKQGLARRDFIGACVFDLFAPDLRAQRRQRNDDVFATGERSHFEDERDGAWTDVTIDPIHDADGNVVRLAIFSRDITDRKRDEAALKKRSRELEALNDYLEKTHTELERSQDELREASEQLAQLLDAEQARAKTDALTGVLNHGAISEVITEAIAAEINFAVAMVDVDGMKAVNDTYGHQTGDDVLITVANAIRRGGAIVGRYGGDEFLVALLNADGDEASAYKAAVDTALADAHVIDPESGARVPVVASLGIASYPADAPTLPELIEQADEGMYAEKRARQGVGTGLSSSRILGSERAARMVGELVPLLTSAESVDDKLRLVAHRVTVGGGYAGVNFDVFVEEDGAAPSTASQNAFTKAPDELIEEWNRQQRAGTNNTGVGDLLRETRRPLIIDSIETSAYVTDEQRKLLLSIGILSAIVVPLFSDETMVATMSVGSKEPAAFGLADEQFLTAVAGQVAAIIRMARLVEHLQAATDRLESSRDETVMLLAAAAEAHSQAASLHYENVRAVAEAIAVEMGIDTDHVRELGMAAALHDIGKIRVPDSLLSSPERVSPSVGAVPGLEEWELLKEHCIHGRDFLERTTGFELAARIAYTHHERWDGGGYPEGLAGEAIPLESAIIAVADSLDAIMSERAYQAGRPLSEAMSEIVANRGTQFRPDVVDALVVIHERGGLAGIWDSAGEGPANADDEPVAA